MSTGHGTQQASDLGFGHHLWSGELSKWPNSEDPGTLLFRNVYKERIDLLLLKVVDVDGGKVEKEFSDSSAAFQERSYLIPTKREDAIQVHEACVELSTVAFLLCLGSADLPEPPECMLHCGSPSK